MKYQLRFGALSPPLHEQVNEQTDMGLTADDLVKEQMLATSIVTLLLHSILTETEVHKARKRLMKRIDKTLSSFQKDSS